MPGGKTVNIIGALDEGSSIGVTMEENGIFTGGWSQFMNGAEPTSFFTSDNSSYILVADASGELVIGAPYTVTYDANGATSGSAPTDSGVYASGGAVAVLSRGGLARDGYGFTGWQIDGDETVYANADEALAGAAEEFTITGDTTLVAQWAPLLPEETPGATFTATGADCGELSGLVADAAYVLSGAGLEDETITADESGVYAIASGLTVGTLSLVKTGNGRTTSDSEARSLAVTRADTPELTVTQPKSSGDLGGVDSTAAHEYSADNGESWTDCEENQSLASGGCLVRVKASGVMLASEPQSVVITTFLEGEGSVSYDMQGNTVTTVLDVSGDCGNGERVGDHRALLGLEARKYSGFPLQRR